MGKYNCQVQELTQKHAKIFVNNAVIYRDVYKTKAGKWIAKYNGKVRTLYLSDYGYGWHWYMNPISDYTK